MCKSATGISREAIRLKRLSADVTCSSGSLKESEKEQLLDRYPADGKWMTAKEAAAYLRRSEGALYNLVYRNQIARYRFGRKLLFKRSELDRVIESSRQGGHNGY